MKRCGRQVHLFVEECVVEYEELWMKWQQV